ncbi:unnamed protein product [Caenorhabditis auriculariae]|uniref:Cyclic nucleotide-binding domain-containing protein n=1 Tax=Caenorhabditis auriculariae TaxID=2777116 RepID=A0A8S1HXI4_9PELO|nr:unnamed protein product [Caenorhabditis auriculariae]
MSKNVLEDSKIRVPGKFLTFTPKHHWRRLSIMFDGKQSQPQHLEEQESSRSASSHVMSTPTLSTPEEPTPEPPSQLATLAAVARNHATTFLSSNNAGGVAIQIETADDDDYDARNVKNDVKEKQGDEPLSMVRSMSLNVSSASERSNILAESDGDEDIQSQLSFIMKERLHSLAKEVHRRTSAVRQDLMRESPEDTESLASANTVKQEVHRPSLMSLIGLQQRPETPTRAVVGSSAKTLFGLTLTDTIHPYGRLYMTWLAIVTFAFLYNVFCIPLRSSYPYQTSSNWIYWFCMDCIADFIYLFDMIMIKPRLRFMRGGIQVKVQKETRRHYLMTRTFKLDIISILPTDFFYIYFGTLPIWRLNRIFKINSFWLLFDMLDNSFSNPYAIRIARTLSYMIYIIHCNSCIYYKLSALQAFGQIAYHENGKWYIYMTCSWMMGVFVFALLLGQIRDIVSNANRNREEFQRRMDKALGECKRLGLPKDLTDRVRDWFIYTWQQQKTLDEKKLIEKLPLKLQTDLALSVHYNTLSKVQLFQDCDRALLRDLVLKLRPVIFLPNDMICRKGDVGKEMYIVNQGVLQVVGGERNELVFAELGQGAVFGEISLLAIGGNNRRTASIRAKGYATLFVLAKEDLNDVIRYYPQAQALLKRKASQMLKNDKKSDTTNVQVKTRQMEDRCKISTLNTPKILKIVADLLPQDRKTTRELRKAMQDSETRRQSMSQYYPWHRLKVDYDDDDEESMSDVSDMESVFEFESGAVEISTQDALEDAHVIDGKDFGGNKSSCWPDRGDRNALRSARHREAVTLLEDFSAVTQ